MNYIRDPNREFSSLVKREEKYAAHNQCRICGNPKELTALECAHIYTLTKSGSWERSGSDQHKCHDDNYVSSIDNCLLLCKYHHDRIDSQEGLQRCTVPYLQSLKTDLFHCTALINHKGTWRRCGKSNGRGNTKAKSNGYRCHLHLKGGLEDTLPVRSYYQSRRKSVTMTSSSLTENKKSKTIDDSSEWSVLPQKTSRCTIL